MSTESLSAFAKRRRLNYEASATTQKITDASQKQKLANESHEKFSGTNIKRLPNKNSVESNRLLDVRENQDGLNLASQNNFEPLVTAASVNFSGVREFDRIDEDTIKVRLSPGQRCTISGIARLWVRKGVISLNGAILHSSHKEHMLYAPSTHTWPRILSLSKDAEFQLESVHDVQPFFRQNQRNPWDVGRKSEQGSMSFRILGTPGSPVDDSSYNSESQLSMLKLMLQTGTTKHSPEHQLPQGNIVDDAKRPACVIFQGRPSASLSSNSVAALNRLLTEQDGQHKLQYPQGAYFLDLDIALPEFGLPGTASLVHVKQPILGPNFTHPWHVSAQFHRTIMSYYIGKPRWKFHVQIAMQTLKFLLSEEFYDKSLPIVIKAVDFLDLVPFSKLQNIDHLLRPTKIVISDPSISAELSVLTRWACDRHNSDVVQMPQTISAVISPSAEIQLILQSYFHTSEYVNGYACWSSQAVIRGGQAVLRLDYGDSSARLQFLCVNGGCLRKSDLPSALECNLVYIVYRAFDNSGQVEETDGLRHYELGQLMATTSATSGIACLGMGVVKAIDEEAMVVHLCTSVPQEQIDDQRTKGNRIGLLLEKPWSDGRLDSDWLQIELTQ